MSDAWVEIHHPDGRDGYVTQFAFDVLWSKKGFILGRRGVAPVEPQSDDIEVVISGGEPEDPGPVEDAPVDETEALREQLRAADVKVDKRWGLKRLQAEVATLTEDDPE